MKQVLLIAYDFPPRGGSGVFRVAKFARYLPDFGWQPSIVTVAGEGPHPDHRLLAELPSTIEVARVSPIGRMSRGVPVRPTTNGPIHSANGGWRVRVRPWLVPDTQLPWVPGAIRAAERRIRRGEIDAVVTSGPPFSTHLIGLWLKRRYPTLPWVMDMRDLWSEGFDQHALVPYKLNRWLERCCLEHADQVTVVTDAMARLMRERLETPDAPCTTITNGFDREDIEPYLAERRVTDTPAEHRPLRLCYVGTITEGQRSGIVNLFAAIEQIRADGIDRDGLHLQLVGAFGASIHQRAEVLVEAGMVSFLPFQPHREAIACMMDADVLVLVRPDDLDGRIVHTSKVFEYMAVGRPIFAIAPRGEITRLIEGEQLGRAVAPTDVDAIAATLHAFVADYRAGRLNARRFDLDQLQRWERRTLTGQLARLLDGITATKGAE